MRCRAVDQALHDLDSLALYRFIVYDHHGEPSSPAHVHRLVDPRSRLSPRLSELRSYGSGQHGGAIPGTLNFQATHFASLRSPGVVGMNIWIKPSVGIGFAMGSRSDSGLRVASKGPTGPPFVAFLSPTPVSQCI